MLYLYIWSDYRLTIKYQRVLVPFPGLILSCTYSTVPTPGTRAVETAQSIKFWLCKHEDLGSFPSTYPGGGAHL